MYCDRPDLSKTSLKPGGGAPGSTQVVDAAAEAAGREALADAAVEPNPFFRPDFLLPYLQHMERHKVAICAVSASTQCQFRIP